MPDTQITDEMIRIARDAFNNCRPVERTVCQDFGMQQNDILEQQLKAALTAALSGHVVVPRTISDAQLNKALGREEDARITPMFSMFRDFYHNIVAAPPVERG